MKNLPSVSETDPYPSGGVAAARVAAVAAELASAVADHSREQWAEAGGARAQAEALGRRAAELGQLGAEAYAMARLALADRGPVAPQEDQATRDWKLGRAIEQAAHAPLELAANASNIAELARLIASQAADDARADAVIAALLAAAAARAAASLVRVNLAIGDRQPASLARTYAETAAASAAAADRSQI